MSLTSFPEPDDLQVDFVARTGDSKPLSFNKYSVENPHPGFGKDPNILNEYGHTKYPMWVGKVIVKNEEEEKAARGEPVTQGWGEAPKPKLREDGPTIKQYVDAGYKAKDYPPAGYESKHSKEEIDKAIADELAAEEAAKSGWGK